MSTAVPQVLTAAQLLKHYQEHRRLTRRVIEAFPADQINSFTIGGLRTFGALVQELLGMPIPTLIGMTTGKWETNWATAPEDKATLLAKWDAQTPEIDRHWPKAVLVRADHVVDQLEQSTHAVEASIDLGQLGVHNVLLFSIQASGQRADRFHRLLNKGEHRSEAVFHGAQDAPFIRGKTMQFLLPGDLLSLGQKDGFLTFTHEAPLFGKIR